MLFAFLAAEWKRETDKSEGAMSDSMNGNKQAQPSPRNPILGLLGSLKFALPIIVIIALACIAGTVIPQGSQVGAYLQRHPDAHGVMHVLTVMGLTRVFYSWWFVALLFLLAASLLVCTHRRYQAIGRSTGALRARATGSFITHVSLLLVIAGGVMRVLWGQKGMIQFHEGETATQVVSPEGAFALPFAVKLTDFELEHYATTSPAPSEAAGQLLVQWPEKQLAARLPATPGLSHPLTEPGAPADAPPAFKVAVLRYVPDFSMDGAGGEVVSRSSQPNNPAIQVAVMSGGATNTRWVFARFPDFGAHGGEPGASPLRLRFEMAAGAMGREGPPIKAFKSTVQVLENGAAVLTRTVAVNSPLSYRGYTFYQTNYDPEDLTWSALQVVKDPGIPVVYAGFVLMMVGLTVVFCVGPWLDGQSRKTGETP